MSTLTQLQTLVQTAIGNSSYTAATITGHLNQGCREAAALVRLPGLSVSRPVTISYKRGGVILPVTSTVVKIYSIAHGLATGDIVVPSVSFGATEISGKVYRITKVDADNFTLDGTLYNVVEPNYTAAPTKTIAVGGVDIAGADVKITVTAAHGFSDGDVVYIGGETGTTELNGNYYTVTVVDATSFTLDNTTPANYSTPAVGDGTVYAAVTIQTPWVALPSDYDYQRQYNITRIHSVGQDLDFDYSRSMGMLDSWDLFTQEYPLFDETGSIENFCVNGNKLWFHPMPSSDTIVLYYMRVITAMEDGVTTTVDSAFPEWFHNELVHFAAAEIYEEQGQLEMSGLKRARWLAVVNEDGTGKLQRFVGPADTPPKQIEEEGEWYANDW